MISFDDFLAERLAGDGFLTADALASFLPLLEQTAQAQQHGKVAPLCGTASLNVLSGRIFFAEAELTEPTLNLDGLKDIEPPERPVQVIGEVQAELLTDGTLPNAKDLWIAELDAPITHPVYLPGYESWEQKIGHHDSLTDSFSLGMILASLSCGLNFHLPDDLQSFVANRGNLFAHWPTLHPVIAKAIVRMTELDRRKRPQDLSALLASLENYREQDGGFEMDLARAGSAPEHNVQAKRQAVLSTLQQRLFEISRRNRLLHFRLTAQSANLTWASVPLSHEVASIRGEELFIWNEKLRKQISEGKTIALDRCLRFEEALYLPTVLDKIRREAQRDKAEYGFAQLRLVLGFLRWSNLKESPPERYESPLVLLPVELSRQKGVRDRFQLQPLSTSAEINPVVRQYFKQLYGLHLPAEIDLAETDLGEFHQELCAVIQKSEPGVELNLIDRPRIRVIHAKAKRRLDSYRKRARLMGPGVKIQHGLEYSYHPQNFQPLGLKLFESQIAQEPLSSELLKPIEPDLWQRQGSEMPAHRTETIERKFHQLVAADNDNPYVWEMDLCSLTLGNFRYRKMSLVRDYDDMLTEKDEHPPFDSVFSLNPKPVSSAAGTGERNDQLTVLACDPTQSIAIAQARAGESYIIQGPPGTGKSQTITNLIADYVGQGKRVLFVCEKRAAIDVVHHRLKQIGLASLCCLIHDSQADKKAFVMDLKDTYEAFQQAPADGKTKAQRNRTRILNQREEHWQALTRFEEKMASVPEESGVPIAELLTRAVLLKDHLPELSPTTAEQLPKYACWAKHAEEIKSFLEALTDLQPDGVLANHSFRLLGNSLAEETQPKGKVLEFIQHAMELWDRITKVMQSAEVSVEEFSTWNELLAFFRFGETLRGLAKHRQLSLLDEHSEINSKWSQAFLKHQQVIEQLHTAREATKNWRKKLPPAETAAALDLAQRLEGKFFSYFKPSWWRLRGVMKRQYNFDAHSIHLTWVHVLETLQAEYKTETECNASQNALRGEFHFTGDAEAFQSQCAALRKTVADQPAIIKDHLKKWQSDKTRQSAVVELAEIAPLVKELNQHLSGLLVHYELLSPAQLRMDLEQISGLIEDLPEFLYCLKSLKLFPAELQRSLRTLPVTGVQLEAAMVTETLAGIYAREHDFKRFDGRDRAREVNDLNKAQQKLPAATATLIQEQVVHQFRENLGIASQTDSQLTALQQDFKKRYNKGRKLLEHEFGKQMRHKPIRELATGDSGLVVRDLKPVWLMSPLSVADTLPLDPQFFDVIIFDEASQITLEEAMPSVFRANQIIVVGDEMQLPPTNFFASKKSSEEDSLWVSDEEGETVAYDLDGNSFLSHAARNLPSTMLGWHYRSRSESLISFSNAAFYQGRLLTVPEETLVATTGEIVVSDVEQGRGNTQELLARAVSFHFIEPGCYEDRRNTAEAQYIAELVRGLLMDGSGLTVGVVAFSEAQQGEIEEALKELAEEDPKFGEKLEAEWEREDDGQFTGLLVKNLENIQGDERDVILLSVCYAPNSEGKMRMNFGPINQSGGEKRLNVAFSRSKHHMAIVSSIRHHAITNDYNEGARALKNYLHYADAYSAGNTETAQRILQELARGTSGEALRSEVPRHPVLDQIQQELEQCGYVVDRDVGQSQFRCHLAVYREGDREYRLGILVDTPEWYQQAEALERELMRPTLLEAFGWRMAHVLVKDWQADPAAVLKSLEEKLTAVG